MKMDNAPFIYDKDISHRIGIWESVRVKVSVRVSVSVSVRVRFSVNLST